MEIRKCIVDEAKAVGAFYDEIIKFMDNNGVNYPKWLYKIYPTTNYVIDAAQIGNQFICAADLGRTFSGIPQFCLYERNL